ncbi:hypothetical protein [Aliikangiella coralliicola]|uniref:Uncharacterized protein n=1 Tax=Aliikangiella coralliicola TaxID=2592383 RepID=A0A545UDS0_9GAMM|nr:hypothetical protein [Aliikangiella coralliicola]TQV87614.1 hypothetical protein FLL46_12145 [Aliikangiella coralliicola]
MKNISKKSLSILVSLSAVVSLQAFAGTKSTYNVTATNTTIAGSFGSARNSADNVQVLHIGDTGSIATIWARNAAGDIRSCTTNNAGHLAALRSATSNSYLISSHSGGTCNTVRVYKGSLFAPKEL